MRHWMAALLLLFAPVGSAVAQSYPSKNIRIIVAAGAGGGVDTISRVVAQKLPDALGQTAVVENRAGAGGAIGSDLVAKSAPDGHTLLTISIAHAVIPSTHRNLAYNPERDLVPIAVLVNAPNVLVAHPSLPVKSVKELVSFAKARPGEINYASSGNGSPAHLATEYLKLLTSTDLVHVPYKGTSPGMNDVIAGRVSLMFGSIISTMPHVHAGKLKTLGVAGATRAAAAPDIPTLAEAGVTGYAVDVWYALLAPAATPRGVLERLNHEVAKMLHAAEVKQKIGAMGLEPVVENLAATDAYIKSEIRKWARVVQAARITAE
jgi:tripartite-type tricarboxylate transporter receptor subunit TctC